MPTLQALPPHRAIGDFLSPASFWFPEHLCESAWIEHAPFAFWLIEAHQPALLVELGTHWGYSFFAFCQAVQNLELSARCVAVDTWQGDDQAGRYGEDVFESVNRYNAAHYAAFASLMRTTFDGAAPSFADRSIDLLHIDGRHAYDNVSHDFAVWLPKLSRRGIVVFHDVNERKNDFDVWRLWSELREKYPHFEFEHAHGLGILAIGEEVGPRLRALFDADADEALSLQIRQAYARLGAAVTERIERVNVGKVLEHREADLAGHRVELARVQADNAGYAAELARVQADNAGYAAELTRVKADLAGHAAELTRVKADIAGHAAELTRVKADAAGYAAERVRVNADLNVLAAELARRQSELATERDRVAQLRAAAMASALQAEKLTADLDAIKHSTSWRITHPLRLVATALRLLVRRQWFSLGALLRGNEGDRDKT
jgi:hypothetical protein